MRAKGGVTIGRPMDCGPARTAGGGRSGHGRRKGRPARRCKGVRGRHPLGTAGGPTARTVGVEVALLYSHGAQPRPSRRGAAAPGRAALGPHAPFSALDGPRPLVVRQTGGGGARAAGSSRRRWRPAGVERWSTGRGWQATCPRQARLSGGVPRTRSKGGLPATCVMHHPRVTNGGATPSIAWVIHTSCPQCMMCNVYIRGGSRPVAAWEGGTCRSGVAATGSDAAKWACGRERPSGRAHPHADLWTWGTCAPPPPRPCCLWRVAPAYIPMGGGGPALVGGSRPRHCQHRGARPRTACVVGWLRPAAWARWMTVLVPRGGARPRSDRP